MSHPEIVSSFLDQVFVVKTPVFADARGYLQEFSQEKFAEVLNIPALQFVHEYYSSSAQNVIRGLHYQLSVPQGKLVSCSAGRVFDVAVDVRAGSPTFGEYFSFLMEAKKGHSIWVPPGFAHGFLSLEDNSVLHYRCTAPYAPAAEQCIVWNDPEIGIQWPVSATPNLSEKDVSGLSLSSARLF